MSVLHRLYAKVRTPDRGADFSLRHFPFDWRDRGSLLYLENDDRCSCDNGDHKNNNELGQHGKTSLPKSIGSAPGLSVSFNGHGQDAGGDRHSGSDGNFTDHSGLPPFLGHLSGNTAAWNLLCICGIGSEPEGRNRLSGSGYKGYI